jgi:hypothetical protein
VGSKRKSYSGGIYWKQHNPDTTRCRCRDCMRARHPEQIRASATAVVKARKKRAEKPVAELLPIELGEHKTSRGLRAFVMQIDATLRWAYGFTELKRAGQIFRTRRTWGLDSGKAILSGGRYGDAFDLIARIRSIAPAERSALIEQWERTS